MLSCGFNIIMLFDFGINAFNYSQINIKSSIDNVLFKIKCVIVLVLVTLLTLIL